MKTINDLIKDAGKELSDKIMIELSPELTKEQIIDWFYTPILALDNQSPYDMCKKGEHKIAEDLLNSYSSGVSY